MKKFLVILCALLAQSVIAAENPAPRHWDFKEFASIPVLSGGRLKPLDTLAREWSILLTGSKKYQGWQPAELLISWLTAPQYWMNVQFIPVGREDVRREMGLDDKRTKYSPKELLENPIVMQYAQSAPQVGAEAQTAQAQNKGAPKMDVRVQERRKVFERLAVFRGIVDGAAWTVIPDPDPKKPWIPLAGTAGGEDAAQLRKSFLQIFQTYLADKPAEFHAAAVAARSQVEALLKKSTAWEDWQSTAGETRIQRELFYNHFRPFLWAWILYLLSALFWTFALREGVRTKGTRTFRALASTTLIVGFLCHSFGFILRALISGRPPVTNMYESVVWVSWGVVVFAGILYAFQRQGIILLVSSIVSTICLIIADAAPAVMDPSIHPLVAVLRSNYWLTIHVLTITLGYAAFALVFGMAKWTLYLFFKKTTNGRTAEQLRGLDQKIIISNQLTYRAMQIGTVLIAAGTILGGIWADESWGRFWGWDPKEVWALIVLLSYLAILHARMTGWIGQFGFTAWSVGSFLSVIMAWYGVNFVLGEGLHSYGFSTGGRGPVSIFVLFELALILFVAWRYKKFKLVQTQRLSVAPAADIH